MNDTSTTQDPAAIERDIRRTQDQMSRTVDKIGDQFTARNLFNALLDKADENDVDARMLIDGARRNPIALGLIAAGAIWLVSDKDSKFPSMPHKDDRSDELDLAGHDVHHRDYVSHMSAFEMRDGEDPASYQRRRDLHRANFLMCERKPDEDDHSFRQRLDDMTESFRQKRQAWADSAGQTGSEAKQQVQKTARKVTSRAEDMYDSNPLIGGILAAAVGAALGSAIPISRKEQEALGEVGAKARDMASEEKDQLTGKLREKADELTQKADQKLQSSEPQPKQPPQTGRDRKGSEAGAGPADGPFIISERSM
jgi:ElaB/YqjD/DUF883 family membrane-anchored ribosome-binding protein